MSPARADFLRLSAELAADIESAAEKANHLKAWGQRLAQGDEVYIPAALLHHYYTAIESCLSRAAATLEGTVPGGPDSHTRLLRLATLDLPGIRPAILTAGDYEPLREVLDFRHLFRHGYGIVLRPERLAELSRLVTDRWPGVKQRLEAFRIFVDECARASVRSQEP